MNSRKLNFEMNTTRSDTTMSTYFTRLLDTFGHWIWTTIRAKRMKCIKDRQYGFRKGRLTLGANNDLLEVYRRTEETYHATRCIIVLATLDVKNTFNTARWADILQTIKVFNVLLYFWGMLEDLHLWERQIPRVILIDFLAAERKKIFERDSDETDHNQTAIGDRRQAKGDRHSTLQGKKQIIKRRRNSSCQFNFSGFIISIIYVILCFIHCSIENNIKLIFERLRRRKDQ